MTVIVFDGTILAADKKCGSTYTGPTRYNHETDEEVGNTYSSVGKIYLCRARVDFKGSRLKAVAGAGVNSNVVGWKDLIFAGKDPEECYLTVKTLGLKIGEGCTLVVLTEDSFWKIEVKVTGIKVTEVTEFPHAIGSGSLSAMTAMTYLGVDALGAVAVASTIDPHSGSGIDWIDRNSKTVKTKEIDHAFLESLKPTPVSIGSGSDA